MDISGLGKRIRDFRLRKGMTINELAEAIDLSASAVSQIERGVTEPALRTIRAFAEALGTPLFSLFLEAPADGMIVRKDQRRSMSLPAHQAKYELVTPDLNRKIEVLIMYLEPGVASSDERPLPHSGDECLLVLKGMAEMEVDTQVFQLDEGDSVYLNENIPHRVTNIGESELICIVAITPASF